MGDVKGGEAAFRKALTAARAHKHRNLAPILVNLADVACERRDADAGLALLSEAAPIMARVYPDDPWRSAWVEVIRANCLLVAGKRAEALKVATPATAIVAARWPRGSHYGVRASAILKAAQAGA